MMVILDNLHNDHINFSKVLSFLELQLKKLKACDEADLELILLAIQYMKEYPDQIHHPYENIVFRYYLEHYPDEHDAIKALIEEHDEMPSLTLRLLEMLQAILVDEPQSREVLCKFLDQYIKTQKAHMDIEEESVYPLLKSCMHKDDWRQVDNSLGDMNDPVFGKSIKSIYQPLFDSLS